MSVTGPGCAACNFTGTVPWASEPGMEGAFGVKPCDACGGFSQFAVAVVRAEDDWRPLPSVAEVLAHNARTGGDCFGPWLCVADSDDGYDTARVVMLCVVSLDTGDEVSAEVGGVNLTDDPAARWRPITRRGGALPWPGVPR